MKDLIERLEAATGPDQELDCDILAVLIGPDAVGRLDMYQIPEFTGSIDAACTVVPARWSKNVTVDETGQHAQAVLGRSYPTNASVYQEARTIPLALCIAALKAMCLVPSPDRSGDA